MPIITWVINYSSPLPAPRSWEGAGWQKTEGTHHAGRQWLAARTLTPQVKIKPQSPFPASLSPDTLLCCCFCFSGSHPLAQAILELATFLPQPSAHHRWVRPGLAEGLSFWIVFRLKITLPLQAFSGYDSRDGFKFMIMDAGGINGSFWSQSGSWVALSLMEAIT